VPLGAVLYAGVGRHPLAGLAAAFAGVSGGFGANLLITALDPLLAGLTQTAAQLVDPTYVVLPTANWYFNAASVGVLTVVGTVVSNHIIEPRLGPWAGARTELAPMSTAERRGLLAAGVATLGMVAGVIGLVRSGVLSDPETGLKPLYDAIVIVVSACFLVPGLVYGAWVGTLRTGAGLARMGEESMATMGGYIVLAFVAAQFIAWFGWSNLGLITAVKGAGMLTDLGLTGLPLLFGFICVSAFVNLLIASASAKWAIMGPVFVPMLMILGFSPETTQAAYRVGDAVTNIITPLLPYFPLIIAFARTYVPDVRLGTLLALMVPYTIAFGIAWVSFLLGWIALGIPLGPGAPLTYVVGG
jgi:aminobenzoyl-glutamate transport protein